MFVCTSLIHLNCSFMMNLWQRLLEVPSMFRHTWGEGERELHNCLSWLYHKLIICQQKQFGVLSCCHMCVCKFNTFDVFTHDEPMTESLEKHYQQNSKVDFPLFELHCNWCISQSIANQWIISASSYFLYEHVASCTGGGRGTLDRVHSTCCV